MIDEVLDFRVGAGAFSNLSSIGLVGAVSNGLGWYSQGVISSRELAVDGRLVDFRGSGGGPSGTTRLIRDTL